MLTRFSSNQPLIANAGLTTDITTDPVGVGDASNALAIITVHTFVGTTPTFEVWVESSNDGANWSTPGAPAWSAVGLPPGPVEVRFEATAAFSRLRYKLIGGSDQAYIIFDVNVRFFQM